jgi:hypothetical protein
LKNYQVIYTNGCSWTSGSETADRLLFEDWPGEYNNASAQEWFNKVRFKVLDDLYNNKKYNKLIKFIQDAKLVAWPSQLSVMTNIPVINDARSGNSQEHITITSIDGLLELLKTHSPDQILAIIQLTSPYRLVFPQYKLGDTNFNNPVIHNMGEWISIVATKPSNEPVLELAHQLLLKWPNYHLEKKYMLEINHIINFCVSKGIDIKLFHAWDPGFDIKSFDLYHSIKDYYIKGDLKFSDIVTTTCPGGHPGIESHINLAKLFKEILFK